VLYIMCSIYIVTHTQADDAALRERSLPRDLPAYCVQAL
jgi:hypothetical protein